MRFRSSGLGKTELKGRMSELAPAGDDLLVYKIKVHDPVNWELKAGMEHKDVPQILKAMLKPSILFHTIRTLLYIKANPKEVEDLMDKSL